MSRIGKSPIFFDKEQVKISINPNGEVTVKGPKATQMVTPKAVIKVKLEEDRLVLTRANDDPKSKAFHGLYRSLLQNAVTGVTKGWAKSLILNGVGYRAKVSGKELELTLGYSHPIKYAIPEGIEIKVEKQTTVTISGANLEQVGQVAARLRDFRPPEPYLGKGIRYSDEVIRRKAGKSAGK